MLTKTLGFLLVALYLSILLLILFLVDLIILAIRIGKAKKAGDAFAAESLKQRVRKAVIRIVIIVVLICIIFGAFMYVSKLWMESRPIMT